MVISARVHYACLAMIELAERADDVSPVAVREISNKHGVPGPFLVQILRTLRSVGWVQSTRGSQGGYRLAVDPTQVTLLDVAEVFGCQESSLPAGMKDTQAGSLLQKSWSEAAEACRNVLAGVTLSELVDRSRHGDETMFYI
jgi:Rrf2 family protein